MIVSCYCNLVTKDQGCQISHNAEDSPADEKTVSSQKAKVLMRNTVSKSIFSNFHIRFFFLSQFLAFYLIHRMAQVML